MTTVAQNASERCGPGQEDSWVLREDPTRLRGQGEVAVRRITREHRDQVSRGEAFTAFKDTNSLLRPGAIGHHS